MFRVPSHFILKFAHLILKFVVWIKVHVLSLLVFGVCCTWQTDGETVKDFIFLGSKITAEGDCIMKLKDACSLEEKL